MGSGLQFFKVILAAEWKVDRGKGGEGQTEA